MSEKAPAKDIPPVEFNFQVEILGSVTRKRFIGDFTSRIPRMKEQSMIEKHEAILNGNVPQFLPTGILKLHKMISYLRYTLIEPYPKFWRDSDLGFELMDINVVEDIYNKVLKNEEEWMKQIWGDKLEE
jgi:hypothetical protein